MENKPLITVILPTHNHAPFIGKSIESVLMQKTRYSFDVLLHDDASTDGTAEICHMYATKYPDKITLLAQTVNQYQYDRHIQSRILFPRVNAKYTAILDGDDYWIDPLKLDRQIEYMEAHEDCTLCISGALKVDIHGNTLNATDASPYPIDCVVNPDDLITAGGEFCASSTIVAPTKMLQNMPDFCLLTEVEDLPVQLLGALCGYAWYFAAHMTAYRFAVPGSWSTRQYGADTDTRLKTHESIRAQLTAFDTYTQGKHHEAFQIAIRYQEYLELCLKRELCAIKKPPYRSLYKRQSWKRRLRLHLEKYCPHLVKRYISWKSR